MATYKEIHGINVQYRDSDATAIEGDVWYNASTGLLKMYSGLGAWATGGALNTARYAAGGFGIQTAAVMAAGDASPGNVGNVEEYDGSSWTEVTNITTTRRNLGTAGILTAGLGFGGRVGATMTNANTEEYDGTNWTEVADLNTGRRSSGSFGVQGAAFCVGGAGSSAYLDVVESWNSTSWTETTEYNTGRQDTGACGTTTAGLLVGGTSPAIVANTEIWDGSSWTEVGDLTTARTQMGTAGTSTFAMITGGTPAAVTKTELWDGDRKSVV